MRRTGSRERLRLIVQLRGPAGREVDVVILNDAPPTLARLILNTGKQLLVRDPQADHAFLRRARRVKLEALAR